MRFDLSLLTAVWPQLASGTMTTLGITAVSFGAALILGFVLTVLRLTGPHWIQKATAVYVNVFRVLPELGIIFLSYYCLPTLIGLSLSEITCGVIALAAIATAYTAEIFRAGYKAIPAGQTDAAVALGLGRFHTWRIVLAPQIISRTSPALINCGIDTLKNSTLLAAIGASELAYQAYQIGTTTYNYLVPFTFVAVVFFLVIFPLSLFSRHREAAFQRRAR